MADVKRTATKPASNDSKGNPNPSSDFVVANRETVESVVVAIILALLFRAFVAEAFVIPTGSMAPTLMGRHVDVWCDECRFHFQASASAERTGEDALTGYVVANARCPNCGYRKSLDLSTWSNETSMSGDRIIVSKTAYELGEPQRWDVIVFKYPQKAQQNYIKRLIGLPNETIMLSGGNVYVKGPADADFHIARKTEDSKLLALLQVVHDARYPSQPLLDAGWPLRWQPHGERWQWDVLGTTYKLAAGEDESFVRYHHFDDPTDDWQHQLEGASETSDPDWRGALISDFYAYNSEQVIDTRRRDPNPMFPPQDSSPAFGQYWVDDLALECEVEVGPASGDVLLDIVRAGVHYTCRIDASTGKATLTRTDASGASLPFADAAGKTADSVSASTRLRGSGRHRLRMSNVDHEVRLWVDGRRIAFDGPTTYASERLVLPDVDSPDGDLAPIGIGGKNQALTVHSMRVLRDKYYVACRGNLSEYQVAIPPNRSAGRRSEQQEIAYLLTYPDAQSIGRLLGSRRSLSYELGEDQFMPLGDNSPASSDARYWDHPYVERHLLVGKALFIYWPHTWNNPPFLPNFRRMQPIR